jgi:hypothetical protein
VPAGSAATIAGSARVADADDVARAVFLAGLDARNVTAGPVAFRLPVGVHMAFHGTWVPAETFRTRRYGMEIAVSAR